jgi:predicted phosphodiesterase
MKLVFLSDTHNQHNSIKVPDGDVLIHSGDATSTGKVEECKKFLRWYAALPHKYKIFVAGNHDWSFDNDDLAYIKWKNHYRFKGDRFRSGATDYVEYLAKELGIIYLNRESVIINGVKFYGCPESPRFHHWAFNRDECDWKHIPGDTNVLITHTPPKNILDLSARGNEHCGCPYLMGRILELSDLKKLKIHCFGHIHEARGVHEQHGVTFINGSCLDEKYRVIPEDPIIFDLPAPGSSQQ